MTRLVRSKIFVIGLVAAVGLLVAAFGVWYSTMGDTTTALAALVDPTTIPPTQPTRNPTEKAQRKQANQQKQAELAAGAFGTIQAINGQNLTLQNAAGESQTFALGDKTRLIVIGKPEAALVDLQATDKVLILGAKNSSANEASVTPRVVVSVPAAYTQQNLLVGRVTRAAADALAIQTSSGTKRVTLGTDTQIFGARFQSVPSAELKVNATVMVFGEPQTDDFAAQTVLTIPKLRAGAGMTKEERKAQKRATKTERKETKRAERKKQAQDPAAEITTKLPGAFGTVNAASATEIQVETEQRGEKTILLDPSTKIIVVGQADATIADIQTGNKVIVVGGNKKKPARIVIAAPATYTIANLAAGKIKSVDASALTIKNKRNKVNLAVTEQTQVFGTGLEPVTLADLEVKQKVLAIGARQARDSIDAQVIVTLAKKEK